MREPKDIDIVFDFDGVICANNNGDYANSPPYPHAIENVNKAYDMGYYVKICTARYGKRGPGRQYQLGFVEATEWLKRHGVKYHELIMGKPAGDIYVDDKACVVQSENGNGDWENNFWPQLDRIKNRDKYNQPLDKQA